MPRLRALEQWLLSLVIKRDVEGLRSSATLQRALGMLFVAGATIGTLSMAFPQPPGTNVVGLFVLFALGYAVGALLLVGRGRLPAWSNHAGLATGTLLVTLGIVFTDERTS